METKKEKTIYEKLLECQKELGVVSKDKVNPFFKANYADINNYLSIVKPVLSKHGLILLQPLQAIGESNFLTTKIIDANSEKEIESIIRLPENPDPQKMGSIITYFRRFAIQSLLALQAEDDDAQKASGTTEQKPNAKSYSKKTISQPNNPATEAQKKLIKKLIKESGDNPDDYTKEIEGLTKGQASEKIKKGIGQQKKKDDIPVIEDGDWEQANEEMDDAKNEARI